MFLKIFGKDTSLFLFRQSLNKNNIKFNSCLKSVEKAVFYKVFFLANNKLISRQLLQ